MSFVSITGYEGIYEISRNGEVKSLTRTIKSKGSSVRLLKGRHLKIKTKPNGYLTVALCKHSKVKFKYTHRLVAEAFIPNPENKPQVNHINGIKSDNRVENLEWITAHDNLIHARTTGLIASAGSLNEVQVLEIATLLNRGDLLQREIADIYQVSRHTVTDINNGNTWSNLTNRNKINRCCNNTKGE